MIDELVSQDQIEQLVLLARGNVDLVEQALIENLELRKARWHFGLGDYFINIEKVIEFIKERVDKLENVPIVGDDNPLNS